MEKGDYSHHMWRAANGINLTMVYMDESAVEPVRQSMFIPYEHVQTVINGLDKMKDEFI